MSEKRIKVQPGKTQSKVGFAVKIVMVLIGFIVVIPAFGAFGILWTAIAVIMAYMEFKNGFSEKGIATHEIVIEDDADSVSHYDAEEDIEAKLIKLNSLYEQRLITKEEYDEKRKSLLGKF